MTMRLSGTFMEIWRLKYWTHRRGHGKKGGKGKEKESGREKEKRKMKREKGWGKGMKGINK